MRLQPAGSGRWFEFLEIFRFPAQTAIRMYYNVRERRRNTRAIAEHVRQHCRPSYSRTCATAVLRATTWIISQFGTATENSIGQRQMEGTHPGAVCSVDRKSVKKMRKKRRQEQQQVGGERKRTRKDSQQSNGKRKRTEESKDNQQQQSE